MDIFSLERATGDMLKLIGSFHQQWGKFVLGLDKLGKRLDDAQKEFLALTTTRRVALERPLRKIEALRKEKGLEPEVLVEVEAIPSELETGLDGEESGEDKE